jgi:AraC family transcriptional activator of pobA
VDPPSRWAPAVPTGRQVGNAPVYAFARTPGRPPIGAVRLSAGRLPPGAPHFHAHAHDFLVIAYFDRGGGDLRVDERAYRVRAGDVFVVAPGEVVGPEWTGDVAGASAWTAFFPVDAVDARAGAGITWRAHPLLFPFVGSGAGGLQRLRVAEADRPRWSRRFAELADELVQGRDGSAEAAQALLTLLLVELGRLAADVVASLRLADEPLLAAVFDVVERRFAEPISSRDVAAAVGLTPGHLTTVVRRRTGRTVQQWLTERRLTEARRLLADSRLTVAAVATRVGYQDAGYFIRRFRAAHGVSPSVWRRAG